ncbi:cellulose biosynthesis protein BcsQ [Limnobacter parvus]|uniref:Cellulose biosynthesis protein BcsQ n=1 Tax=Limnobacter parvus TaxID=2939690 RepID=A0ABT1XKS0_9BURK|nr:cellulose biosynthesis protein BcsQ [Limnobacter parvus]MCR2747108.1 cellulose biosynthesis protein BcsQ [Limnobacter parvus]
MIILALVSPSGGAGRTSLSIAVANHLCMLGRNVVLVQADPANNIEFQLGYTAATAHGLGQVILQGAEHLPNSLKTTDAGFQLLPFGQLSIAQQLAVDRALMERPERLAELLRHPAIKDNAVVVIDLPRWPAPWCLKTMAMSDLNLVTLVPDSASILGIDAMLPHLLKSRGASYFLMNRFDSAKVLHLDLWTLCKMKLSHRLLPFYLHEDQALSESMAAGLPLADYAPRSQLVDDQQKLCNWIDSEIG